MKKTLLLIISLSNLLTSVACSAKNKFAVQNDVVSVQSYGAKGDGHTDDAPAFIKAISFCIKNHKICFVPKTTDSYNIGSTIRVSLEPGESLKISSNGAVIKPATPPVNSTGWNLTTFKEHVFLSVGKKIDALNNGMFKYSDSSSVDVSGLEFDGANFQGPSAPSALSTDIFVGMQVLAEKVDISNCVFKNIYGYGITIYNVKNATLNHCRFENVGGRGATPAAQKIDRDAFGDGVHFSMVKTNGTVTIRNCDFAGLKTQGKRSRSAITFEFSNQPYTISVSNVGISGFAKCMHIEERAATTVNFDDVRMSDFNFGIVNVLNDSSVISLNNIKMDVGLSDGNDAGDALAFLNYRSKAKIYVTNSYLNFKGRKQSYQSAPGLMKVKNTTINGNNTNFFFADGSTVFENCNFIAFGGNGPSFFGGVMSKYKLINCKLKNSSTIHANGQKLKLEIQNQ